MNNTMKKTLVAVAGIILVICAFLSFRNPTTSKKIGSVDDSYAYIASSTNSAVAGLSQKYKGAVVGSTPTAGLLGSFVITGTSATVIEIKDATSTTDLASTTLAIFAASTAAGTYTFDAAFSRGLIINYLGAYAGNNTVTYR